MRHLEISQQTYQRWRSQYGALRPDDLTRLKKVGTRKRSGETVPR